MPVLLLVIRLLSDTNVPLLPKFKPLCVNLLIQLLWSSISVNLLPAKLKANGNSSITLFVVTALKEAVRCKCIVVLFRLNLNFVFVNKSVLTNMPTDNTYLRRSEASDKESFYSLHCVCCAHCTKLKLKP